MKAMILSYANDTNGQNARFAQASAKWGDDDGVIQAMAVGATDPAGVVGRFQDAAEKFGTLRIRSAHRAQPYMDFPVDILWTRQTEVQVRELAEQADLIHLNNSEVAYRRFKLRKPALLHHHGSLFRGDPQRMLQTAKHYKMVQAVSTVDLQKPAPDVLHWLPSAYDIDKLAEFGKAHGREPDGRVLVVHCPTNRTLKHTDVVLEAIKTLQAEGLPVDLELVEGRPWAESLEAKARADIVFDQLAFGYGCNSIEAWGMGKPVISGADEWTLHRMAHEWPAVPFEEATKDNLVDVIRAMVQSPELRADAAERGHAHVRKYHDELPALTRLAELYGMAIREYSKPRIAGKGASVTFTSQTKRAIVVDNQTVTFPDGKAVVSDPFVINRLRYLAGRKSFGIREVA